MTDKLTENMPRIRIAWTNTFTKESGHGEWLPESSRKNVMQWIAFQNKNYPDSTRWIEEEK